MPSYSEVLIIYNPTSTGGHAEQKATKLAERLRKRDLHVVLQSTKHPGHAEALAYQACLDYQKPLIISASGDGGYNEVVNGIMRATIDQPGIKPVCAVLPSGNANDHRRSVRKRPLAWAILNTEPEQLDLLQLSVHKDRVTTIRYAHSYIGVGITTHIATYLNATSLNRWRSNLLVARSIFTYHPVAITNNEGRTKRYDSLIFAIVPHMARILRTGDKTDINNGSFRVAALPHRSQFWPVRITLNILLYVFGLQKLPQQAVYNFSVPQDELIHLDGEVIKLPGQAEATVSVSRAVLTVIR